MRTFPLRSFVDAPRALMEAAACVLCVRGRWPVLLFCMGFLAAPGYIVCIAAAGFAALVAARSVGAQSGILLFNALLSGAGVAWLGAGSSLSWGVLIIASALAGVFCFVIAAAMQNLFPRLTGLPVLGLPFVLTSVAIWILTPERLELAIFLGGNGMSGGGPGLPGWLVNFFKSFGVVFFLPNPAIGFIFAGAMAWASRWSFLGAVLGYLGVWVGFFLAKSLGLDLPSPGLLAYNALLTGMLLGANVFVPSRHSMALAFFSGLLVFPHLVVLLRLTGFSAFAGLPLPFLLVTWELILLAGLRVRAESLVPSDGVSSPEDQVKVARENRLRFPDRAVPLLVLPFSGERVVTQGMDGSETHRGPWKYALDFEIRDKQGRAAKTARSSNLTDFYTMLSPVLSPVNGVVVRQVDGLPDNKAGHNNFADNWGNHLVIHCDAGGFVTLAHFANNEIRVRQGERVHAGMVLGLCGNSGRSPIPHLHLQFQKEIDPSSETLPFRLGAHWKRRDGKRLWCAGGVPLENERIHSARHSDEVAGIFQTWRTGTRVYSMTDGERNEEFSIDLELDVYGRHRWSESAYGVSVLGACDGTAFTLFHRRGPVAGLLTWMSVCLSRVPYVREPGTIWEDCLPLPLSFGFGKILRTRTEILRCNTRGILLQCEILEGPARCPRRITCDVQPCVGLVRMDAVFASQTFTWELQSFPQPQTTHENTIHKNPTHPTQHLLSGISIRR